MSRVWLSGSDGDGGGALDRTRPLQAVPPRRDDPAGVLIDGQKLDPVDAVPAARHAELNEELNAWFAPNTPAAEATARPVPSAGALHRAARSLVLLGEHDVAAWMRGWAVAVAAGGDSQLPRVDPRVVKPDGTG